MRINPIIHEFFKKQGRQKNLSIYSNIINFSQFRTRLSFFRTLINRKSTQEKESTREANLLFFQLLNINPKIYREGNGRFFAPAISSTAIQPVFFSGLANETGKRLCVQQVSLSRFPRPVMNILFYLPFTRLRALRPMTCLLTSTIACTNVDRPFLSGPNTDLSIFIRPIILVFTRHAYHDSDWQLV